MFRMSRAIVAGTLVLGFGSGAPPAGRAADPPAAWPEAASNAAPAFTLPSDKLPPFLYDYLYRTDPTGKLVPNSSSPNIPSQQAGKTDLQFLTANQSGPPRLDTTLSACMYYNAISGVTGVTACGPNGELQGSSIVTFDAWKQAVRIDKYGPKDKTDVAHFINQVDLNLTRDHHMISHAPDQLAAYVCNHAGPSPTTADPTGLFPPQSEVNGLIRSLRYNAGLIACVAMEYSTRGQPSGTLPFTKFFIFGANGALLSTVDLDGRGPKGVPNVCTACHGGPMDYNTTSGDGKTAYFDPTKTVYYDPTLQPNPNVPSNIRPAGDLGAHFLPFDKQNFAFSDKRSQDEQDQAIFRLNVDVYTTEITRVKISNSTISPGGLASASITDMINGWYHYNLARDNPAPGFDASYVPFFWDFYGPDYDTIYRESYARSCRTCHSAMERVQIERDPTIVTKFAKFAVCNSHIMPNAKVTFDRFWLSDPDWTVPPVSVPGQPASASNQPELLNEIMACVSFNNP